MLHAHTHTHHPKTSIKSQSSKRVGIVKGALTAFAEKHGLLTQAHELTKSRRKTRHLSFILYLSLL
jgi:hypothetical protein